MHPALESLYVQRAEQLATMDAILGQVEGRDLVDAERSLLETTRQRIDAIDAQINLMQPLEDLRAAHNDNTPRGDRLPAVPRRADMEERITEYATPGSFLVDYIRAVGYPAANVAPDPQAAARVQQTRVIANNVTGDLTGVLPTPIVGQVVNLIDPARPLISSLGGAMALGGIPGTTFTRPKITQHVTVGLQTAEKTEVASQKMIITPVVFPKQTFAGSVDISRQAIDWTQPAAWDIIVRDLANVYATQTELAVATAFKAAATGTAIPVATDDLKGWAEALYAAAAASYQVSKRMPDRIWVSLDVWVALGSLVDIARLVMPPSQTEQPAGDAELGSFRGDVIGLPRIVVPTLPSGTCIVGPSSLYEVYEEMIGLLSVVEPSILGVTVAYGGYLAQGNLAPTAFVPLTAPAGMFSIDPVSLDAPEDDAPAKSAAKKS